MYTFVKTDPTTYIHFTICKLCQFKNIRNKKVSIFLPSKKTENKLLAIIKNKII